MNVGILPKLLYDLNINLNVLERKDIKIFAQWQGKTLSKSSKWE